jgi:hypothetical protein
MAKTIQKTVYSFRELLELAEKKQVNQSSVERVREKLSGWLTDDNWWAYNYECWESALNQIGFDNAKLRFSGFWSQGDGASFTADVDAEKLLQFMTAKIVPENCIKPTNRTGTEEDFIPWVVYKLDGDYGFENRWKPLENELDHVRMEVVRDSSHYCHEKTCRVSLDYTGDSGGGLVDEWHCQVEKLRLDLCRAIYKSLEEEYEGLVSDESLIDFDEANGYCWDDEGRLERN